MGAEQSLTLGALHRGLRGTLGENSPCRASIVFEQRATVAPRGDDGEVSPGLYTKRAFKAELDFDAHGMSRAELSSSGITTTAHALVSFLRDDGGYLYSPDGLHFGRYRGAPTLFDIHSFEQLLDVVAVRDVTIDRTRGSHGGDIADLDIDLDIDAFRSLLRTFGSDVDDTPDDLELNGYSLHLAAGGDLTVDYWWQLSGDEQIENADGVLEPHACRITCHVTLRLVPLTAVPPAQVPMDDSLPELTTVDDVWALARRRP